MSYKGLDGEAVTPKLKLSDTLCPPVQCAWAVHIVSAMIYLKRGVQLCPNEGSVQLKA